MAALPATLHEWRRCYSPSIEPRDVWSPLESWLEGELGFTLFGSALGHGDDYVRKHAKPAISPFVSNGFAHLSPQLSDPAQHEWDDWQSVSTMTAAAIDSQGRAVVIRLVAKGDQGLESLEAYRRIAQAPISLLPANHALPYLTELHKDDMTFLVFPLVGANPFYHPWFYSFGEVVDAIKQILQGVAFCHERLVAHRDLFASNVLYNCLGPPYEEGEPNAHDAYPYRSLLPFRYYFIDFELAIAFDQSTPTSERLVTGLPIPAELEPYNRPTPPEMLTGERYCPFRADVWQLGWTFSDSFSHLGELSSAFLDLCERMRADDPNERPTAAKAFEQVKAIEEQLSLATMRAPVPPRSCSPDNTLLEMLTARDETKEAEGQSG